MGSLKCAYASLNPTSCQVSSVEHACSSVALALRYPHLERGARHAVRPQCTREAPAGDPRELPDSFGFVSPFQTVKGFVKEVKPAGPYLALIETEPGAGHVVAQAIDSSGWDEVVGTVAGPNSVLLLTDGAFDQKLVFARLRRYLDEE